MDTNAVTLNFTPDSGCALRAYWLADFTDHQPDGCAIEDGLGSLPIVGWALVEYDGQTDKRGIVPCVMDFDGAVTVSELDESLCVRVAVPAATDPTTVGKVKRFLLENAEDDRDERRIEAHRNSLSGRARATKAATA